VPSSVNALHLRFKKWEKSSVYKALKIRSPENSLLDQLLAFHHTVAGDNKLSLSLRSIQPPSKAHSQIKMSSNHLLPPAPAASTHSQPRMSDPPILTPPVAITRNWPSEALQNPRRSTFDDILTPPPVPGLLPLYVEQEYGQPSWCCIPRVKMFANYVLGIVSFGGALFLIAYMIYAIITKPKTAEMVSGGLGVALSAPA
jgi:hypothetical protein